MRISKQRLNWIFGIVILALGVIAIRSFLSNRERPVLLESSTPNLSENPNLPENHPPIDSESRLATLEEMSRQNPLNAEVKSQIGNAYYDMGLYQKAIEAYQESIQLQPHDPNVETDLATCYHYLGRHDEALEVIDRVLQKNPGFAPALFNKGVVLEIGKKDTAGAAAAYEQLLQASPNHPMREELEKRIHDLKAARK